MHVEPTGTQHVLTCPISQDDPPEYPRDDLTAASCRRSSYPVQILAQDNRRDDTRRQYDGKRGKHFKRRVVRIHCCILFKLTVRDICLPWSARFGLNPRFPIVPMDHTIVPVRDKQCPVRAVFSIHGSDPAFNRKHRSGGLSSRVNDLIRSTLSSCMKRR